MPDTMSKKSEDCLLKSLAMRATSSSSLALSTRSGQLCSSELKALHSFIISCRQREIWRQAREEGREEGRGAGGIGEIHKVLVLFLLMAE